MAVLAGAQRLAYGYYAVRSGRVEATLTVEDLATRKMPVVVSVSAGDVVSAAAAWPAASPGRRSPIARTTCGRFALSAWRWSREMPRPPRKTWKMPLPPTPISRTPYATLAQLRLQRQDRPGALALLESALARSGITGLDRARLEGEIAALRNDLPARQRALAANLKIDATDPVAWRGLAETDLALGDYQGRRGRVPLVSRNRAGRSECLESHGLCGSICGRPCRRDDGAPAIPVDPPGGPECAGLDGGSEPRHRASAEAEEFFLQAARRIPTSRTARALFKAALSRLMTGDVAGADAIARQFVDARQAAQDPLVEFYKAEWAWVSGRRKAAAGQLEEWARGTEAGPLREAASRAYGEAAIWRVLLGDRDAGGLLRKNRFPWQGRPRLRLRRRPGSWHSLRFRRRNGIRG